MTVKDFFENFEDKGGSMIRIISNNDDFDIRIGYNYINTKNSMWCSFIAAYGNYLVTKWYYVDIEDVLTLHIEENKDEGKCDYNISYNIKVWNDNELGEYCSRVHKSELADVIENIFACGGYNMKISCVERKDV